MTDKVIEEIKKQLDSLVESFLQGHNFGNYKATITVTKKGSAKKKVKK